MNSGPFRIPRGGRFDSWGGSEAAVRWGRRAIVSLIVVLLLWLGASIMYRIDSSDEGVVLRFGKQVRTVPPGLHFKFPWPVEAVFKVPVQRIQSLEFGFETIEPGRVTQYAKPTSEDLEVAEMLTGDLNLAHVEWIVQYRIKDPQAYLFHVGETHHSVGRANPSGEEDDANPAVPDTIADVSESVMRKLVGDASIDDVLTIGRERIAREAQELIQAELDEFAAGVDIVTVKLQTTSPPTDKVQDAFQEVNRARQTKERVVNEAQGERNSKIPAARGARDQAIAEAEGYQSRVILETTGKISAFNAQLAEYDKAREITRRRLYLEAIEEVLGQVGSKTIIDESVQGVLPLLNLDQAPLPPQRREGGLR